MPGPVLGQGTTSYTDHLFLGGAGQPAVAGQRDLLREIPLDLAPVTWEDTGGAVGSLTFTIEDTAANREIPGGVDVRLIANGTHVFGGTLVRRRMTRMPGPGRWLEMEAVSYDSWLDWHIVPRWSSRTDLGNRVRKITTDRGEIVIDYRNSSNGYYGGNLTGPTIVEPAAPPSSSPMPWRQITDDWSA